jgi:hypothetical protein
MGATAGEGTDMVHLRCRCGLVVLQAHLTQGMLSDVAVPDAFPCSAVSFLDDRAALVGVIVFIHQLLVLLAVPVHGQLLAAGVGARFLWFPWQSSHLHTTKAFKGLLPRRLLLHFYAISIPRRTDTCVRYITHVAKIIGNDCPNDIAEEQVHHLWFHK